MKRLTSPKATFTENKEPVGREREKTSVAERGLLAEAHRRFLYVLLLRMQCSSIWLHISEAADYQGKRAILVRYNGHSKYFFIFYFCIGA